MLWRYNCKDKWGEGGNKQDVYPHYDSKEKELGQCKARPLNFVPVCFFFILFLFFFYFFFFISVLQQITVLAL